HRHCDGQSPGFQKFNKRVQHHFGFRHAFSKKLEDKIATKIRQIRNYPYLCGRFKAARMVEW
ncbi:MAG: hypothetical protein J6U57_10110, partial [Bacteroidales bacterium]|nr:hypothetical protein [Bacteroidales bacterium]